MSEETELGKELDPETDATFAPDRETVALADEMARKQTTHIGAPIGTDTEVETELETRFEPRGSRKVSNRKLKNRLDQIDAKLDAILMAMNVDFGEDGDTDD